MAKSVLAQTRTVKAKVASNNRNEAHVICRSSQGIQALDKSGRRYRSGLWDINEESAAKLVGGRLYFHEHKSSPAYFGGKVLDYEVSTTDQSHTKRISFLIEADASARGHTWEGRMDRMAWFSGAVSH